MSKIKDENYYQISGWMLNRLELRGVELQAFAIIYGFSQDGSSSFSGSMAYLCDWLGVTKPTALKALASLVEKRLLLKEVQIIAGVQINRYRANLTEVERLRGKEILPGGSKETLPPVKNLYGGGKEILPGGSKEILPYNNALDTKRNTTREDSGLAAVRPLERSSKSEKETKHRYGEYENVLLTDEELDKLKKEYPNDYQRKIDALSAYIASKGAKYKSHYATIRNWARKDEATAQKDAGRYHMANDDWGFAFQTVVGEGDR